MRPNDGKAFLRWEKEASRAVLAVLPDRGVERTIMWEAFDPSTIVVWLVTASDQERDALLADQQSIEELVEEPVLGVDPERGYRTVLLTAQSEETVARDFGGDWWAAIK